MTLETCTLTGNNTDVRSDRCAGDLLKTAAEQEVRETQRDSPRYLQSPWRPLRGETASLWTRKHGSGDLERRDHGGRGTKRGMGHSAPRNREEWAYCCTPAPGQGACLPRSEELLENKRGPGQKDSASPALRCPIPPSRTLAQNGQFRPLHSGSAGRSLPV